MNRKLPIGIQGFEKLREDHFLYVDKTEYIYQLAHNNVPYFLSRPRRFGKSLLLSALKAYWEGKQALFRGLKIEQLESGNPNAWKAYPVFYSTGNHEEHRPDLPDLLSKIRDAGAHVPETEAECIEMKGNELEILSLPCLKKEYDYIPEDVNRRFHTDRYRIMLSHRPSWIDLYNSTECDLILSGHAHGGQWRIPALHRGLIAPSAGFFPKYTEGVHELNGKKMVISRGLTKKTHGVIRLYNNPEIVVLDLIPEVNNAEETAA